jgi:hypothetical protein
MISFILAAIYLACGVVYLTPGVLPAAALPAVKWSRHGVGAGMLLVGVAQAEAWWGQHAIQPLLYLGLAVIGIGLAATLVTILRQPCPPKA